MNSCSLSQSSLTQPEYRKVLFAGTFDHLHEGHKHVLKQSLIYCSEILFIGLASDSMLNRKQFAAGLEPLKLRKQRVEEYLKTLLTCKPDVHVEFLETADSIGPAATLDFNALIVTPETFAGGVEVNTARSKSGCEPVALVTVNLLADETVNNKTSSTATRARLCNQLTNGHADLTELMNSFPCVMTDQGRVWWSIIRDMYGLDSRRKYHNLTHVMELLYQTEIEFADVTSAPFQLLLAVWFHDCVYNPCSSRNEDDSVAVFAKFATVLAIDETIVRDVSSTILMTKNHLSALSRPDVFGWQAQFLEMDLAILGSSSERYREYAGQIREEYSYVIDYGVRRSNFLSKLKPFRFQDLSNKESLNTRLMENIHWELQTLLTDQL